MKVKTVYLLNNWCSLPVRFW